ncbi:MAG: carboxylesterase/lipase family protein, partial [Mycobacteriaceae bacterium]|nr:carboxylesterase/lipase family protein [Mycobacteriaceae bacterium]
MSALAETYGAYEVSVPVVRTRYGDVRGFREGDSFVWRSVPYAAPIAGPNRFRRPVAPRPWQGERDCTRFGAIAPQGLDAMVPMDSGLEIGEDCLWVNVWAPARPDKPRPVLVWLHGGAYCLGTAAQALYDGRRLAELGDMLVVGVNYRVGAFGFLDLSSLSRPGTVQFDSNLGLWDQVSALEWIRDNIAEFGGDPDNVTLFGESSGAGCVTTLMTSPRAEGLFHRAIAQSPPATSVYGPNRAAGVARRYLELAGVGRADAADLCTLPLRRLVAAADMLVDEVPVKVPGTLATAPVVDGDLVPDYPV